MELKPTDEDPGSLAAAAASFPLLVYDHGEQPDNSQTVLSVADGSSRTYRLPEMRNSRCLETPQGLVLVVDNASLQCSLWNPQTGENTPLPAMDEPPPASCRCLVSDIISSPPHWIPDGEAPPDSLVVVCDFTRPELLLCRIRGGGAAKWVRQPYDYMGLCEIPGRAPKARTITEIAAVQGIFYFLKSRGVVGALVGFADDPEPRLELVTFEAPKPTIATDAPQVVTLSYLLESSGELFLVCLFFLGCTLERVEEVGAYVMDFGQNRRWLRETDIGDRAFILGPGQFAASCPAAEHGLREGCVYYAYDFLRNSNEFHIFDLKDGTREVAAPTQDIPSLSRRPFWLVPVHPGVSNR